MSKLTASDRQLKLETLAALSADVLSETPKKELDSLCSGLVVNVRSYKKQELLELIADLTADLRLQRKLQVEQELLEVQAKHIAQLETVAAAIDSQKSSPSAYREALALNNAVIIEQTIAKLDKLARNGSLTLLQLFQGACLEAGRVSDLYRSSYSDSTIKSYKTAMNNALDAWVSSFPPSAVQDNIKTVVGNFKSSLSTNLSSITVRLNSNYVVKVRDRVSEKARNFIDPEGIIRKAQEVLENLSEAQDYRDVAIALAIATGRRMAEIMSTGSFIATSDNTVAFSGNTKARKNRLLKLEQTMEIPTLVPASLVVSGLQWLQVKGCRNLSVSDVNMKYAKTLSRKLVDWEPLVKTAITFKSLRALYATVAYARYGSNQNEMQYFGDILGHDDTSHETAFSYQIWSLVPSEPSSPSQNLWNN